MVKPSKTVADLKPGDVILPPPRELSLWMRRTARERGLSDSALHLTVVSVREGQPDKSGRWLVVAATHTAEWNEGGNPINFRFKARPETAWHTVGA